MKKTVVIGAHTSPERYAYLAADMLQEYGHEFVPVGVKKGQVLGKEILDLKEEPAVNDVDTITLYINPYHQQDWYDYLLNMGAKRIIFNPGTENNELAEKAKAKGIEPIFGCTLVMLRSQTY